MATSESVNWTLAHVCQALRLCFLVAEGFGTTASLRLIESNICRNYYRSHDPSRIDADDTVAESLCKIAAVQQDVVQVNGLLSGVSAFPALIAALLYLPLSRLINNKKLLLLNMLGIILGNIYYSAILYFYNTFRPRTAVFYSLFNFIGGGYPITYGILQAKIARSVPQASLSAFQLYYTAAALVLEISGTSLGLWLMKSSPWLPMVLMICVYASTLLIVSLFFEDKLSQQTLTQTVSYQRVDHDDSELSPANVQEFDSQDPLPPQPKATIIWKSLKHCYHLSLESSLPIAVLSFYSIGYSFRLTMPYWMSGRYDWELREVGWVQLGYTLWTALVVALLPSFANRFFRVPPRTRIAAGSDMDAVDQPQEDTRDSLNDGAVTEEPSSATALRDLRLAKFCILLGATGTFLIGISWYRVFAIMSLAVLAGEEGFGDAFYSFLAFYISRTRKADAYDTDSNEAVSDFDTTYIILELCIMMAKRLGGWIVSMIDAFGLAISGKEGGGNSAATSLPTWFCTFAFLVAWWTTRRFRIGENQHS